MKNGFVVVMAVATLGLAPVASATDWSTCREMGLNSTIECKKYDEDPVFRAQVRRQLGLPAEVVIQTVPTDGQQTWVITGCDSAGCRDTRGVHYPRGVGNTYNGPSGPCQLSGNMMRCN